MAIKASLLKGTRDFGPAEVERRNYIINCVRSIFEKYGFRPLETPAMEKIEMLTDKYGEEGDQLLFRVLNNGDFLAKADNEALEARDSKKLGRSISKRGLRYDLTVPFARYVAMNQHVLSFPFKRYQIQAVWRADRPQKGRYQEFYQCDVDIIGSTGLVSEAELLLIYDEVFEQLKMPVVIKYNSRKILNGIAQSLGIENRIVEMTAAIDKWDKVGKDGVRKDLERREFSVETIDQLLETLCVEGGIENLESNEMLASGLKEIETIQNYLGKLKLKNVLEFDPKLARGLNYYTGCIMEVKAVDADMGSIGGGGRYDDLTGVFGLKDLSGVGVSFGLERIYDLMIEKDLFPEEIGSQVKAIFLSMDEESLMTSLELATQLRRRNVAVEIYPTVSKFKKQIKYANNIGVDYALIIGEEERENGEISMKNMQSGEQKRILVKDLLMYWD